MARLVDADQLLDPNAFPTNVVGRSRTTRSSNVPTSNKPMKKHGTEEASGGGRSLHRQGLINTPDTTDNRILQNLTEFYLLIRAPFHRPVYESRNPSQLWLTRMLCNVRGRFSFSAPFIVSYRPFSFVCRVTYVQKPKQRIEEKCIYACACVSVLSRQQRFALAHLSTCNL